MTDFDQERFLGTWHVLASTFPMWGRGDRTLPRFHYGSLGPGRMSDRVTFNKKGREREILGIDRRLAGAKVAFRWRGRGLLAAVSSDWQVSHLDPDYRWAVITFSRSLFTPAGLDIIGREPQLPEGVMAQIKERIGPTPGLFAVPQR